MAKKKPKFKFLIARAGDPGKSYSVPGKGTTTRKPGGSAKTYAGSGEAPSGTKKVPEKTVSEVPSITIHDDGHVTTSGYPKQETARAAKQATERRQHRIQAILHTDFKGPQKRSQAPTLPKQRDLPYHADPTKAVISSRPNVNAKPPTFQGMKTAGTPTRHELQVAAKQGTLKTNKAGYATTPKVRQVAQKVAQAEKAVRKSGAKGPLHSTIVTTPEQSEVARTVLRVGQKIGANRKEKLAALATGLQESGFKNLPGGAGTSEGWRQELSTLYPEPRNVKKGAENFFDEAKSDTGGRRGRGETIPHLAQAVQASGAGESFYADNVGEAKQLLHEFNRGQADPKAVAHLKAVQQEAKELGLKVKDGTVNAGPPPKKLVSRVVAAEHAMSEVKGLPYVWGGGHGSPTSSPTGGGLDCSGAVGYVLNKIGAMKGSLTSGSMGSVLKPGPGALTVFYNNEHTFLRLINKEGKAVYWGTSVGDSGAGGLGPHPAPSASYLAQYNVGHVPGMGKKQALQLGATPGSLTGASSFPGMTLSSSGTTATIETGAGTTLSKPGFSNKPIQLTARQEVNRAEAKLQALSTPKVRVSSGGTALADLEKRYGKAAV